MNLPIHDSVRTIMRTLQQKGFECYVIGGSVRDLLLGTTPSDWDVTTNALPQQVQGAFARTFATGLAHGTVTVVMDGLPVEVTTYRVDGEYRDHRRPQQVQFTASLEGDLKRRDFTINALAYNEQTGLVDLFDGRRHLKERLICAIGAPDERFAEDALRMLRAIRFSAQLDFNIQPATMDSIQKNAPLLAKISGERVQKELTGFLMKGRRLALLQQSGICPVILPELAQCFGVAQQHPCHCLDVGGHCLAAVEHTPPDVALRYAALLHDVGKACVKTTDGEGIDHFYNHEAVSAQLAEDVVKRLRFDNKTAHEIVTLVAYHGRQINAEPKAVRRVLARLGAPLFEKLLALKRADTLAQSPQKQERGLEELDRLEQMYHEIIQQQSALTIKQLAINGRDLLALGLEGREIGEMLSYLLGKVLDDPALNERETLLNLAKKKDDFCL